MTLIVVESPTKARTFNRILKGKDYFVFASMGHIRDLPADKIAIDYNNNFKPVYQIMPQKRKIVSELKKIAKKKQQIILATDPDREGESIGYHIAYLLGLIKEDWPQAKIKTEAETGFRLQRIVFHEITPKALIEALKKPCQLRLSLVWAQQSRRILDRIVGYELSPLLWKKIGKKWLSAGRVQTIALRLIVEREKEIKNFKIEPYYQISGFFYQGPNKLDSENLLKARLIKKNGINYEKEISLSLFTGQYRYIKTTITGENVNNLIAELKREKYKIGDIFEEVQKRYPPPPYTTSLLSQDAFYKLGFSSKMTMRLAQDLYERGLITYHRTDSFNLAANFVFGAKDYIEKKFGREYALEKPRNYKTKSKMAQEAHEAIRPTKLDPEAADKSNDKKITIHHRRLYQLIFARAVATQMSEAKVKIVKIKIVSDHGFEFQSELQQILFAGFLQILNPAYVKGSKIASNYLKGLAVNLDSLQANEEKTRPPSRFNEASLIKILEERGIGRPSTYAPIISLLVARNYVEKENRYFIPTKLGEVVSDYLSSSFPHLFSLDFTVKMEEGLDAVAEGKKKMVDLLAEFNQPFQKDLRQKKSDNQTIDVEEEIDEKCQKCSAALVVRYSKFGKFLACSRFPKCKFTKPFLRYVSGKICPKDKGRIVIRYTKSKRRFFGCENYPKCDYSSWKIGDIKK